MKTYRAGDFRQHIGYRAFFPEKINRSFEFTDSELLPLLEQASLKLGELNAYAELVPDADQFIRLFVAKEATFSSRIEGTQTTIEETLLKEEEVLPERRNDWQEVQNYIRAMNECVALLPTLPLSTRLIKQAHHLLLQGVRGEQKLPGEFRHSQNWIGGATLHDAAFVPPPWSEVDELMGDLENFLHAEHTHLPHLLKIALAHYQFETIHPFLDGNGRIGRLLIALYLIEASVLRKPVFYLSDFIERHKAYYYEHLTKVRKENDLRPWFRFFLAGTVETCQKAIAVLKEIIDLKHDCEVNRLPSLGRKTPAAMALLQRLFSNPIVRPDEVAAVTGTSMVAAYRLIEDFIRLEILREQTGFRRNRVFVFEGYLKLFQQ